MRTVLILVAASAVGFAGGILGSRVFSVRAGADSTIRAYRFELVDKDGRVLSFWAANDHSAMLGFMNQDDPPSPRTGSDQQLPFGADRPEKPLAELGVVNNSGYLDFRASDGKPRISLYTNSFDKPMLLMRDATGPRLLLGVNQSDTPGPQDNDWILEFLPYRLWMGMVTRTRNGRTVVRGHFHVSKDEIEYPYKQ